MNDKTKKRMERLRQLYIRQLPEKVAALEVELTQMGRPGIQPDQEENLFRMFHTLAGGAPAFGFRELADRAAEAERLVRGIMATRRPAEIGEINILGGIIADMKLLAAAPASESDRLEMAADTVELPDERESVVRQPRIVYIVDDDPIFLERLSIQVRCFGYEVRTFTSLEGLKEAIIESEPSVMVVDMVFPESDVAGASAVFDIQKGASRRIPVIFISQSNRFPSRLAAVKAGGDAYFFKPPHISTLIDKLDDLTAAKMVEPYHILIVDDDPLLSGVYAATLENQGMVTKVVNDPLQIWEAMSGFDPDLILMDIYMPECSGYDLAKVIRQMESYVSIPIVFLSRETDEDKQLVAMQTGGDDFLTKPIATDRLIASVTVRAERMRMIRNFLGRDSLTGLLNRSKIEEQLGRALQLAVRGGRPLTCGMIDIDHFKSVNDTYGHQTGDQVLIVISRLLQKRLRATDISGRYGGEEFLIVFPDSDGENTAKVMDEVRIAFNSINHNSETGEFSVTFSCGLATYPEWSTAQKLIKAADTALYQAKVAGRNRVVLAKKGYDQ